MPLVGTNAQPLHDGQPSSPDDRGMFAVLRVIGAKVLRIDVPVWAANETWFAARMTTLLALSASSGVELMLMLDPTFNGALLPTNRLTALTLQIAQLVGPAVTRWQLDNEVNLRARDAGGNPLFGAGWTAAEFDVPVINARLDAMKAMQVGLFAARQPGYRIIVGTTSTMFGFLDHAETYKRVDGQNTHLHIDRYSYHLYESETTDLTHYWGGARPAFNLHDEIRKIRDPANVAKGLRKAVLYDEVNARVLYDSPDFVTAARTLAGLVRQLLSRPDDLDCVLTYQLIDNPNGPTPAERRFGMMHDLMTPRPALSAFQALAAGS